MDHEMQDSAEHVDLTGSEEVKSGRLSTDFSGEDPHAGLKKGAMSFAVAAFAALAVALCLGLWRVMDGYFTFEKTKETQLAELANLEQRRKNQEAELASRREEVLSELERRRQAQDAQLQSQRTNALAKLKRELSEQAGEAKRLREDLAKARNDYESAQAAFGKVSGWQEEIRRTTNALERAQNDLRSARDGAEAAKAEAAAARVEAATAQKEREDAQRMLGSLTERLETARSEESEAGRRIAEADRKTAELLAKKTGLENEMRDLETALARKRGEWETLSNRCTQAEKQLAAAKTELESTVERLAALKAEESEQGGAE